jgi:hypothetical protein
MSSRVKHAVALSTPGGSSKARPVAGSVVVPAAEAAPAEKPKRKGFFKKLLTPE